MTISATCWAWEQPIIPTAKLLLLYLVDNCNNDWSLLPDSTELVTGLSEEKIANLLEYLISKNCIDVRLGAIRLLYDEPDTLIKKDRDRKPIHGYVYLIRSTTGYYKIGMTINPQNRLETFKILLPFDIEYEVLIETDDMRGLETTLHVHFKDKRMQGEWFDLVPEDIEYIKKLGE